MKVKALLTILIAASCAISAQSPREFYSGVEQHLRSLPSLEVEYRAEGLAFGDSGVTGSMYWLRPDYFLHETPEWMHCDTRTEQWRYLKLQHTLIREVPEGRSDWLPESILLDAGGELEPVKLEELESAGTILTLKSTSPRATGDVFLYFTDSQSHPSLIEIKGDDGNDTRYVITRWAENAAIDTMLFVPPEVPPENLIDFRMAGESGQR